LPWDLWTFLFGLVGALAVLVPPMLWLGRRIRALSMFSDERFSHFLDDWFGEDARPGFVARPGVPERLENVETRLGTVEHQTAQLQRNGGSHLADAIDKLVRDADQRAGNVERLARIEGILSGRGAPSAAAVVVTPPPDRAG
jgi:hypothetical protein